MGARAAPRYRRDVALLEGWPFDKATALSALDAAELTRVEFKSELLQTLSQ